MQEPNYSRKVMDEFVNISFTEQFKLFVLKIFSRLWNIITFPMERN
jgi:hypothetical protein